MREDVSDFYFISLMPDKQLLQIVCSYYGVSNVSQHIFVEYEFWIAWQFEPVPNLHNFYFLGQFIP